MSQVHKVINLKTPLKVFGFTVKQIILLALGVILGFLLASKMPHDWKVGHLRPVFLPLWGWSVSLVPSVL